MSDELANNRRRFVRLPVAVPIELRTRRGFSLHSSQNLSVGGAFFDRSIPYRVGAKVSVALRLPGEALEIQCDGEVVNVPDRKTFGMGVRFLNMTNPDQDRLESFTAEVAGKSPEGPH
jgi:uncharacterized protein (TIGR02266 family)